MADLGKKGERRKYIKLNISRTKKIIFFNKIKSSFQDFLSTFVGETNKNREQLILTFIFSIISGRYKKGNIRRCTMISSLFMTERQKV